MVQFLKFGPTEWLRQVDSFAQTLDFHTHLVQAGQGALSMLTLTLQLLEGTDILTNINLR